MYSDIAIVDIIVDPGDGDYLRCLPIRGGEAQRCRRDGPFSYIATGKPNDYRAGWLGIQYNREGGGAARLRGDQTGGRGYRDARGIVVGIGDSCWNLRQGTVNGIAGTGDADIDLVINAAVSFLVVFAGDGGGLGSSPAGGGEDHAGWSNVAFTDIRSAQAQGDIRGGLAGQLDGEGGSPPRFGGDQARVGGEEDAGGVIVGVGDGNICGN